MKIGLNLFPSWSEDTPRFLLQLAEEAEKAGWDGFFLWDHLAFPWPSPLADAWTILTAAAARTERIRLGAIVTPLPRRRPWVIARQIATLDHLSGGRVVLGAGLGEESDYARFGEGQPVRVKAEKLDESLDLINRLWSGEAVSFKGKHYSVSEVSFTPKPAQFPRVPIWIGGHSAAARRRAARWDGWCPVAPYPAFNAPGYTSEALRIAVEEIRRLRGSLEGFNVVYTLDLPDAENERRRVIAECEEAGATWVLDHVYGLRFSEEEALDWVRRGPRSSG